MPKPPKLTEGGYNLLSALTTGGYYARVSINPFALDEYSVDGDRVSTTCVDRLRRDGYLEASPAAPHKPMFYVVTDQARALACPTCRGTGIVSRELAADGEQQCPQCSGRRILQPGCDHALPFKAKPPRSRRYRHRAPAKPLGFTREDMEYLTQHFEGANDPDAVAIHNKATAWLGYLKR